MARCGSCSAPIEWAKVQGSRKAIPLDLGAAPGGNLIVVGVDEPFARHPALLVRYLARGEDPGGRERRVTHFATCPNASKHRK